MADTTNYYDPNNIPQTPWWQGLFSVLSKGLYKTPEEKYMARAAERDMVQRYSATPSDVDARKSQDAATVARNNARAPTYVPEAQRDISQYNIDAARNAADMQYVTPRAADEDFQRRFRTTQDLNQFPQPPSRGDVNGIPALVTGDGQKPGAPDSAVTDDQKETVWSPWERQGPGYYNEELSEMEKPSFMQNGQHIIPGVAQPQPPQPQMARPENPEMAKLRQSQEFYGALKKKPEFSGMADYEIKKIAGIPLSAHDQADELAAYQSQLTAMGVPENERPRYLASFMTGQKLPMSWAPQGSRAGQATPEERQKLQDTKERNMALREEMKSLIAQDATGNADRINEIRGMLGTGPKFTAPPPAQPTITAERSLLPWGAPTLVTNPAPSVATAPKPMTPPASTPTLQPTQEPQRMEYESEDAAQEAIDNGELHEGDTVVIGDKEFVVGQ